MSPFEGETWSCHVCGRNRANEWISVRKFVISELVTVNVRYCNDRPSCFAGAEQTNLVQSAKAAFGPDARVVEA